MTLARRGSYSFLRGNLSSLYDSSEPTAEQVSSTTSFRCKWCAAGLEAVNRLMLDERTELATAIWRLVCDVVCRSDRSVWRSGERPSGNEGKRKRQTQRLGDWKPKNALD